MGIWKLKPRFPKIKRNLKTGFMKSLLMMMSEICKKSKGGRMRSLFQKKKSMPSPSISRTRKPSWTSPKSKRASAKINGISSTPRKSSWKNCWVSRIWSIKMWRPTKRKGSISKPMNWLGSGSISKFWTNASLKWDLAPPLLTNKKKWEPWSIACFWEQKNMLELNT